MIKYKYFFGSDERSLGFLETIFKHIEDIRVVTLPPKKIGRGRKISSNPVQNYCEKKEIEYSFYDDEAVYKDMEYGIVASFSKIFSKKFLSQNSSLFNIHLSLLPMYKGPTPVETALLNLEKISGFTIFKINEDIDTGDIIFQTSLNIDGKYSTEVYDDIFRSFDKNFLNINFYNKGEIQEKLSSNTRKFVKQDFNINKLSISDAKVKIKAFDYLGPAYITYNDKNLKILSYSDDVQASSIELVDGLLYPVYVVPEGKNKMLFEDYLRGIK